MPETYQQHSGAHSHQQGPNCDHTSEKHDARTDYLHDGHLHHAQGDRIEERRLEGNSEIPTTVRQGTSTTEPTKRTLGPQPLIAKVLSVAVQTFRLRGPLGADPTARVLNGLLWALIGWWGIWSAILLPFHWADRFWSMQTLIVTFAALVSALVLLGRGRLRASALTYLAGIWFSATYAMIMNGGIRSPGQVFYVTLPISAAWLLGYEAALWISAVCVSCALVFAMLEVARVYLPHNMPGTALGVFSGFGVACLMGAVPVAQILRDLRLALTKSRLAEQALFESNERFRITADTAPVMILARDADQNATFFNKEWLDFRGRTLEQELGRGWTQGVHPDDLPSYLTDLFSACAERKEYQLQFRLRRADGRYRVLLCHGVPRFELDRTFDGYIAACADITDFKCAQEEALARQKLESLGVLASGIAHDFNNLLGSIKAESELLMEELPEDSPSREGVSRITTVTDRASEVVRQLMVYAGHESATLDLINLGVIVREMLPLVKVSISKKTTFRVDLPDHVAMIRANATQIRQVVLNLITNASEALQGTEGHVSVMLEEVGLGRGQVSERTLAHHLRLVVSDTGSGMTEEVQARIFDPFYSTKGTGRGLGLASVQGIVRSHGGTISIVSAPGRGSRFEILLPCLLGPELPSGNGQPSSQSSEENSAQAILLVDDEEFLRRAVAKMLQARGFSVLEAGDGRMAVELFRAHAAQVDVVLLDLTLPGLSGQEVFAELKRVRPRVKVIVTSAYGRERAVTGMGGEPSLRYLRKPYQIKELLYLIRETCHE
jgi:PAS domain S-box-containing protein